MTDISKYRNVSLTHDTHTSKAIKNFIAGCKIIHQ